MGKNQPRILVLDLGGTANADKAKTRHYIDDVDGEPKTDVEMWREPETGRMPARIFFEDFHSELDVDYIEICGLDSKEVQQHHIDEMNERIDAARAQGYDRVVVISGTDCQVEWAQAAEARGIDISLTFVGAMREATWDLNKDGTRFLYAPHKKMKSDFWSRILNAVLHAPKEPGAYIEVDGRYEHASNVRKNFKSKRFEAIATAVVSSAVDLARTTAARFRKAG